MPHSIKVYPGWHGRDDMYFYKEHQLHRIGDLTMLRAEVKDAFECIHMTGMGTKCNYKLYLIQSPNQHPNHLHDQERGMHEHGREDQLMVHLHAKYRARMWSIVEYDHKTDFQTLHDDVLSIMGFSQEMRHYIGPFNEVFREALTVRREASILRGWAMPWNEDVPLPGCAPRDQDQERTAMLRRQLQSHEQEIPRAFMQQNNEPNNPLDPGPVGLAIYVMNDNHDIVQGQVEGVAVRILGCKSVPLPTANECGVCKDVGASVAVVGCGCVCICRNCSDNGSLPLKACPMCRGGTKDRNGCLILQRLH